MTPAPDGELSIAIEDWHRPVDDVEFALLEGLVAPVLEVGCGPGRLVAALAASGRPALGIDVAPIASELATSAGAPILPYSVFEPLPGEGRWPTVLILDGSVGIGGDPVALLRRVAELLAPDGVAVIEILGPRRPVRVATACIQPAPRLTAWMPWATFGCDDVAALAGRAGLRLDRLRCHGERWFAWLAPGA